MEPIIVIIGRPNVGKSTLFNRLSKSRTAIVDDKPGITRDRIYTSIVYNGKPLTLMDTGGFDEVVDDPLLGKVKEQVLTAVNEADRIIFMVDGRQGTIPGDVDLANILRQSQKKVFIAVNKADGPEHDHMCMDFHALGFTSVYPISAAHGYGVKTFMDEVVDGLPVHPFENYNKDQIRVAILGKPNAGKSSLINKILGLERMVVSDLPGTTRDTVDTLFQYQNNEYMFIDTAGIRKKGKVKEKIDKFSMIKAIDSIKRCHIAAILIDASTGITDQDVRICGYALEQGRGLILLVNKWDLIKADREKQKRLSLEIERLLKFMAFAPIINISALTGEHVNNFLSKISQVFSQFATRVNTGTVNNTIQAIVEKHPPPKSGSVKLKIYYATQVRNKPPTFVIFVNKPELMHFSYERFIVNQLRIHFGLDSTPVNLIFRKREYKSKFLT